MAKQKKYTRYTRAHLRNRNIRFWLIYLVLIALIVLGLMEVHKYFEPKIEEFETTYYTHTADEMFNKYFADMQFDVLFEREETLKKHLNNGNPEGFEEYVAYQEERIADGEVTYFEVAPKAANEKRFRVTVNDRPFAEFTLKRKVLTDEETGETVYDEKTGEVKYDDFTFFVIPITNSFPWGHEIYEFGDIYIDSVSPDAQPYDYYVPSYAKITVNGRELGEEYVSGEDESIDIFANLGKYADGFTLRHYSFDCSLGEPAVTVADEDGNEIPLKDLGENIYRFEYVYSDGELKPQFEETAIAFLKQWCLFSTHNVNKKTVTELCIPDSQATKNINNYEATWITKADKQAFANASSWNYTMVDGKVLICEVSINYQTVTKGKNNDYPMHMRLYLTKQKGEWKVYYFENVDD